ncbi:MAG: hypothetical protein RR575_04880 [Acinetobacter sp.]
MINIDKGQKFKGRSFVSTIMALLSLPAFFMYILGLFALPEIVDITTITIVKFLIILCGLSGIVAWFMLIHMTNMWIDNIKMGKKIPYISTGMAISCLALYSAGQLKMIIILSLMCGPSILFASYLVWWHSSNKNASINHM